MIGAQVIADSIWEPNGIRLTTLELVYPRFIHSEFMTHRVFSRNASSSRAIPVTKIIKQVRETPASPVHWGKNQPGMQASEEINDKLAAMGLWLEAANQAASIATVMNDMGIHKQVVNRILEPFQNIHVIVTATEWDNFFTLRDHPDAQPEIQALARAMKVCIQDSKPKRIRNNALNINNWHLPYIKDGEFEDPILAAKCSAARCARVSYIKHDGTSPSVEDDLKLYFRLIESQPMHASPVEHQAIPSFDYAFHKNFRGWIQFRELLEKGIYK